MCRSNSTLVLWLSSDAPRVVRVRLDSTLYEDRSAGVLNEFDCTVRPEPQIFTMDLRQFHYSSWAEGFWRDDTGGWRTDADALDSLLQHFTGVVLEPVPQYDPLGQLSATVETGYLRIDNIYFR